MPLCRDVDIASGCDAPAVKAGATRGVLTRFTKLHGAPIGVVPDCCHFVHTKPTGFGYSA
jgi:hypothetical protein